MIYLILGLTLIVAAVAGRRFYVGLTTRMPVAAWQGRLWLLIPGILFTGMGISTFIKNAHVGASFWTRALVVFDSGYEIFGGLLAVFVGGLFLLARGEKVDAKARWVGAAIAVCGGFLIADAIMKFHQIKSLK